MTRVVVAAASSFARAGLEALLARDPELELIAAVAPDAALAVTFDGGAPDVVLLELVDPAAALAGELGSELAQLRGERAPGLVLLVAGASAALAADALRAGARALLRWDASPEEILGAVHAAAAGLVVLPPEMTEELIGPGRAAAAPANGRPGAGAGERPALTPREREVLAMMAEGLGNKSIARRLGISDHTVKTHVAALLGKLGASSRTEAVALGLRRGLVVL